MTVGYPTDEAINAVQANIAAVGYKVYPLSVFLDHPQDLADDESKETETFFNTLDFVYDHLLSVEDFFLWFKETKKTARYS